MVDIDNVMNVVILQNDLLLLDERLRSVDGEGVEAGAEVGVDVLIAVVQREPVEPQFDRARRLTDDLDVGDVVARTGFGQAGRTGPVGLDAEDPVLQTSSVVVVDQ